jgi:tRNA threonylcarbamoyladenosine biosynthesis protein TsaB
MRILAVDTTTARGSVALVDGDATLGEVRVRSASGHSGWLVSAIDFLLGQVSWKPLDVEGYAVTTGPGSFTGLRVGLSTVQGLALASKRPCLGLSALDTLAALVAGRAPTLVALMDAYRDDVFTARFDADARPLGAPRVAPFSRALEGLSGPVAFVGDAVERYRDKILAMRPDALLPHGEPFLAAVLGRMAGPRLARGEGVLPEALRPLYLREAEIRKPPP